MNDNDRDRFTRMAEDYDQVAPLLVPLYDFMQDEMIRQAEISSLEQPVIVDLGAGSGRLLEKAMLAHDRLTCVWVDASQPFLDVARRRLARFEDRVTYVVSAIEGDWIRHLKGPVDAIFSMSAIHHLTSDEKRAVYATCLRVLRPGGWFINTDEMKAYTRDAYRASLHRWAKHVDMQFSRVPEALMPYARRFEMHFDHWKRRNIDGMDKPKTKGDDLHDPFIEQTEWLTQIGFEAVDVFVKYHLWSMVGGRKPLKP